ncbi:MAG: hypothetical protein LQ341_006691, partial [Variospora aurantia]
FHRNILRSIATSAVALAPLPIDDIHSLVRLIENLPALAKSRGYVVVGIAADYGAGDEESEEDAQPEEERVGVHDFDDGFGGQKTTQVPSIVATGPVDLAAPTTKLLGYTTSKRKRLRIRRPSFDVGHGLSWRRLP